MLGRGFSALVALVALATLIALGGAACSSGGDPSLSGGGDGASLPARPTVPDGGGGGLSAERVLFGQSAALDGPAAALGRGMELGIRAAFEEVNRAGGVNGRRLELISLDDRYEPEEAIANTKELIETHEVFALIGAVGTPTSRSAAPIAREKHVPYIAPFTGAGFLRGQDWPNIVNLRASYAQETEEMVERLTADLGYDRIAILFQDDSFGRAGYFGARDALERRGLEPAAIGFYPRNTTAVKSALLDLRAGDPQAVIMVGAYEPVGTLITWARSTGFDPVFITLSFVGSNALANQLGDGGEGVLVTQVVPFPLDETTPVVASYTEALTAVDPGAEPGFVSLEGYLAGRLAIAGLEGCGSKLNRQCFLDALLASGSTGIDGFGLDFGSGEATDNQGSDAVFLTQIGPDGAYRPLDSLKGEYE